MTYLLSLFAAIGVAVIGWGIRRRSAQLGHVLVALGCVASLALVGWQARQTLFPPNIKTPNRAHSVVGFFLASQTQREITGQSGTIVLVLPQSLDSETAENYANAFRAPLLRGHPEWDLQVATVNIPAKDRNPGTIPLAAFKQVIDTFPKALAFVSLAGVPAELDSIFPSGRAIPPMFVFDPTGTTNWLKPLLDRQVRSVIVPRPDVDPATLTGIAGLPGEIFGRLYYLATAETAAQVAAKLGESQALPR